MRIERDLDSERVSPCCGLSLTLSWFICIERFIPGWSSWLILRDLISDNTKINRCYSLSIVNNFLLSSIKQPLMSMIPRYVYTTVHKVKNKSRKRNSTQMQLSQMTCFADKISSISNRRLYTHWESWVIDKNHLGDFY